MPVLVSDTSVIIDLDRGSLLEDLFRLPFEFAVPDLLYRRELQGELGDRLRTLGLRVEELTPTELARATVIGRERKMLSAPDSFAYALAEIRQWPLLTGDGGLRRLAEEQQIAFHGVLWICDQLELGAHMTMERLHTSLVVISSHPRCRLPKAEVEDRLARYTN